MRKLQTVVISVILLAVATKASAQWDDEYKMEIGGGIGMMSYQGDFNGNIGKELQPSLSLLVRRVINPYMGFKANIVCGTLKGSSKNAETRYPDLMESSYSFSNKAVDTSLTYEYNFSPYGTGNDYRGARRFTPFIFLGIGGTYADTESGSVVAANFPIGGGVKYKIARRLNLSLEWCMHFGCSDKLDGDEDPYHIKSSGLFKNRDGYSIAQLTLTYSFLPKCKTCNKDNDD